MYQKKSEMFYGYNKISHTTTFPHIYEGKIAIPSYSIWDKEKVFQICSSA